MYMARRLSPSSSLGIRAATITVAAPSRSRLLEAIDSEMQAWLEGSPGGSTPPISGASDKLPPAATKTTMRGMPTTYGTRMEAIGRPVRGTAGTTKARIAGAASSKKPRAVTRAAAPASESDVENHPQGDTEAETILKAPSGKPMLYSYKQYAPTPTVVYTRHEEETNDLVQTLKGPLGFDLEWVVRLRRNTPKTERRTALVQLCDGNIILLVQISAMKRFPAKLKELLENKDVVKMGANIRNDGQKLFRDYGILPANLVELGALARQVDPSFSQLHSRRIVGLASVVETYTHKTLSKGPVRTSNWEGIPLTQAQMMYAANDAHCALTVYRMLMEMAAAAELELDPSSYTSDLMADYQARTDASALDSAPPISESAEDGPAENVPSTEPVNGAFTRGTTNTGETSTTRPSHPARPLIYYGEGPRPQHMRAYNLWHHRELPLDEICAALRSKENPLAQSTVISYVVGALRADPKLPYSMDRLKAFVQLEAGSWIRHRDWILRSDGHKR